MKKQLKIEDFKIKNMDFHLKNLALKKIIAFFDNRFKTHLFVFLVF